MSNTGNRNLYADMFGWMPYRPAGYPITDPDHNPWIPVDPISGATAYDVWCKLGRPADGETLRAALDSMSEKR